LRVPRHKPDVPPQAVPLRLHAGCGAPHQHGQRAVEDWRGDRGGQDVAWAGGCSRWVVGLWGGWVVNGWV